MKKLTLTLLAAGLAVTAACSSSNGAVKQNAQVTTTTAPKTPQIEVNSVTPSGVAVAAMFQINNGTADEFRFEWAKFTLTYPDGTTIASAHDPNQAPYEAVAPNGIYAGGGNFYHNQTDAYASKFIPGHYVVRYDGKVLKEADL